MDKFRPLVDRFIDTKGAPLCIDGKKIIQMDRVPIPKHALVKVRFVGDRIYEENAAVIGVDSPDRVFLSDGRPVHAVEIWDERGIAREATHRVASENMYLKIYNKYRIRHSEEFITEDRFTGNAGMYVTEIAQYTRRYECSNGVGPFVLDDLVFEVSWITVSVW